MSGDPIIRLVGDNADQLATALTALSATDHRFCVVGGLAVMARIGEAHRPTRDVDGVFDNPTDTPITTILVADGIARSDAPPQRVTIAGTPVDVIDTFSIDPANLPDDPKGRLFVCAHRWAYETATPVTLLADHHEVTVQVAETPALVGMKAHALRYATRERRSTKRASDLDDLWRLLQIVGTDALGAAPWRLGHQVLVALAEDLTPVAQTVAQLRQNDPTIDPDDATDRLALFLASLAEAAEAATGDA